MVRICDGRMSGTAYGTVVLHVAPEAAAGGPLALVRTGDFDRPRRRRPAASTSTSPPTSSPRRTPNAATVAGFAAPAPRLGTALRRPRAAGRHRRRPRLPARQQRLGRSGRESHYAAEGVDAGQGLAHHQLVHLLGALVRQHRLEVHACRNGE